MSSERSAGEMPEAGVCAPGRVQVGGDAQLHPSDSTALSIHVAVDKSFLFAACPPASVKWTI